MTAPSENPAGLTMDGAKLLIDGPDGICWGLPSGVGGEQSGGYRTLYVNGTSWLAHRLAYTLFVGQIPAGLVIDHTCHNIDPLCRGGVQCPHRRCVNPAHLEAVTQVVNNLRGKGPPAENARRTHCSEGHELVAVGRSGSKRHCPICRLAGRVAKGETSGNGHWRTRTHCPQGHAYDEANTYIARNLDGSPKSRMCRTCMRERARARRAARKQQ